MKKILMFQDYFYFGGIEKIILDIKENLENEYDIEILSFVNKSSEKVTGLLKEDYRSFFKRNMLGIPKLKKFIKGKYYDIIHIHCYNAFGLIYAKILKNYCDKLVLHSHEVRTTRDFLNIKKIINALIKIIFKSNKYVYLAVNEKTNKFCLNAKAVTYISNGINYSKYLFNEEYRKEYRNLFNIKNEEIVIGHIGRFEKQKNQIFVIQIFNELCKLKDNYRLVFIGEGRLKGKIKKEVQKLKLANKVMFLEKRNDIPKLINMFDIYLFPSIYEAFGLTVVENEINGKYVFASTSVPKDTKISSRVKYLSLDINTWVEEIVNIKEEKLNLDYRLDMDNYIKIISNVYRGNYDKNKKI